MSKLKVYDMQGQELPEMEVADSLLASGKGSQAVFDAAVNQAAHRRSGTASTLRKGEVAGSGIKPWRQKGTGRARAGYRQSPVWRGGGAAFGPHPRKYGGKINRKVGRLAFRRVLGDKLAAGELRVLDSLEMAKPATKEFVGMMKMLSVEVPALFLVDEFERNVALSCRNLPGVELARASDVDLLTLMRFETVVATRAAIDRLSERLTDSAGGEQ